MALINGKFKPKFDSLEYKPIILKKGLDIEVFK